MIRAAVAGGLVAVALVAAGCGSGARVAQGSASPAAGKQLFVARCGSCHTLADAGTKGVVGPNLDEAFRYSRSDSARQGFAESTIRDIVRGQIAYAVQNPSTDAPGMPRDLVTGSDADAVAAYVASVAGVPPKPGAGAAAATGSQGATDGKTIFASAGCGSCHTLSAAGTNGTIGPNLDQSRLPLPAVVRQVENGGGAMPAFGGQLSPEQIRAVARFVVDSRK